MILRPVRLVRWLTLAVILVLVGLLLDYCFFWSPRDLDHFFGDDVLVIAHRGASGVAPENTIASFQKALAAGADALELDVRLSKDGEVVVIHDSTIDRTTNKTGRVADHTLAQLKELDAGSWFSPQFSKERIPTLQEVIGLARGRALMEIELKTSAILPNALERKVANLVVQNGMEDRVIIQSFNPLALFYVRRANSNIRTALLYHDELPLPLRNRWFASLAHPDSMNPAARMAREEHVRKLHEQGYPVVVWTVDDPA